MERAQSGLGNMAKIRGENKLGTRCLDGQDPSIQPLVPPCLLSLPARFLRAGLGGNGCSEVLTKGHWRWGVDEPLSGCRLTQEPHPDVRGS